MSFLVTVFTFSKAAPGLSFLGLSFDVEGEATKITAFALSSDEAQARGLKANEWLNTVLSAVGGRGGGKPALAQGSAIITTSSDTSSSRQQLKAAAIKFAENYAKSQ